MASYYIDSKTPRGPQRWLRALNNWEADPDSTGGKLFERRLSLARQLDEQYGEDWTVRAFLKSSGPGDNREWRVDFYTCSAFCASMQTQLEFSYTLKNAEAELLDALIVDYRDGNESAPHQKVERNRAPFKKARCQTCGRTITAASTEDDALFEWPDDRRQGMQLGWQQDALEDATPEPGPVRDFTEGTTAYAVDSSGTVIELTDIRVVRLTDREVELFLDVSDGQRAAFAQKHGIPLGL